MLILAGALGAALSVFAQALCFSCGFAALATDSLFQPPSRGSPAAQGHYCFAVILISDAHKCPMGFISSSWDALPHQHRCLSTSKAGQELFVSFKASQEESFSRLNIFSCRIIRKIFSAHWIVQLEVLPHVTVTITSKHYQRFSII